MTKSKYDNYTDEILALFFEGKGNVEISEHLIYKYKIDVKADWLRKVVADIIKRKLADKEIQEYSVRLAKQKQRTADINRIERKTFREHARLENAVSTYTEQLVRLLKKQSTSIKTVKHKESKEPAVLVVHITDCHFNELVDLPHNKYDFKVASKRLYKYITYVKKYATLFKCRKILIALTGDMLNSDRRLDELLALSTNRSRATFLAVQLLQAVIEDLNKIANISVAAVYGNESRVNPELGWTDVIASDSYDETIYHILRLLFKDKKGVNFVGSGLEKVVEINGKNLLLIHGHQLRGLNDSQHQKLITKYSNRGIEIEQIICGHLHQALISDLYARGSSLVGANAYSDNALNLVSRASQNLYIYTNDGRQDIRIDLQNYDTYKGYNISTDLAAYNAKSLLKTKQNNTIIKIVI